MSKREEQRKRETEDLKQALCWLQRARCRAWDAGLELTNYEITTWAEVISSTDWATQVPMRSDIQKIVNWEFRGTRVKTNGVELLKLRDRRISFLALISVKCWVGTWVAQLVKPLTLVLAQVMILKMARLGPMLGSMLTVQSLLGILSLPVSLPLTPSPLMYIHPCCVCSLSK